MKLIPLSNGGAAQVDDADHAYLSRWKWHRNPNGYAARTAYRDGRLLKLLLHQAVVGPVPHGYEIDHWNRNRMDNQRANLRVVTHAVNQRNCGVPSNNTSGHKGVCWDKKRVRWIAKTKHDGKHVTIGRFVALEDARDAYEQYMDVLGR